MMTKQGLSYLLTVTASVLVLLLARAQDTKPDANARPVISEGENSSGEPKISKSEAEWKAQLTPEQYAVMRLGQTERAGSCPLLREHRAGVFRCVGCGAAIFAADGKFDSGTGWPSFWKPIDEKRLRMVKDESFGMERNEILCARCGSHLGHVFDDGPKPSGLRYCINGVALKFEPRE